MPPSRSTFVNNKFGVKYLTELPDGRYTGVYFLPSGWRGSFYVSDCQREVWMKTEISSFNINAEEILKFTGMNKHSSHVVALQETIDKVLLPTDNIDETNSIVRTEKVFQLRTKVHRSFCNIHGDLDDTFTFIQHPKTKTEYVIFHMIPCNHNKLVNLLL
jgi:hypothetical protein